MVGPERYPVNCCSDPTPARRPSHAAPSRRSILGPYASGSRPRRAPIPRLQRQQVARSASCRPGRAVAAGDGGPATATCGCARRLSCDAERGRRSQGDAPATRKWLRRRRSGSVCVKAHVAWTDLCKQTIAGPQLQHARPPCLSMTIQRFVPFRRPRKVPVSTRVRLRGARPPLALLCSPLIRMLKAGTADAWRRSLWIVYKRRAQRIASLGARLASIWVMEALLLGTRVHRGWKGISIVLQIFREDRNAALQRRDPSQPSAGTLTAHSAPKNRLSRVIQGKEKSAQASKLERKKPRKSMTCEAS